MAVFAHELAGIVVAREVSWQALLADEGSVFGL
jgi:hypothetical protein